MKILLKLTDLLVFVLLDLFGAHLQVHGLLDELQVLRLLLVAGELLEYSAQHPVWIQGVPGGHHSPEQPLQELGEVAHLLPVPISLVGVHLCPHAFDGADDQTLGETGFIKLTAPLLEIQLGVSQLTSVFLLVFSQLQNQAFEL